MGGVLVDYAQYMQRFIGKNRQHKTRTHRKAMLHLLVAEEKARSKPVRYTISMDAKYDSKTGITTHGWADYLLERLRQYWQAHGNQLYHCLKICIRDSLSEKQPG